MTIPPSLAQPSISQAPLEELDPNAINKSIIDAKGDLIAGSAPDTPSRVPVGTDGHVLIADASQPAGIKWGPDPTLGIVDAKGDIIVGTAPDTPARLPIGTNGQYLVANSSATEGMARYNALFKVIGYTYGGAGANFTLPAVTDHIIRY